MLLPSCVRVNRHGHSNPLSRWSSRSRGRKTRYALLISYDHDSCLLFLSPILPPCPRCPEHVLFGYDGGDYWRRNKWNSFVDSLPETYGWVAGVTPLIAEHGCSKRTAHALVAMPRENSNAQNKKHTHTKKIMYKGRPTDLGAGKQKHRSSFSHLSRVAADAFAGSGVPAVAIPPHLLPPYHPTAPRPPPLRLEAPSSKTLVPALAPCYYFRFRRHSWAVVAAILFLLPSSGERLPRKEAILVRGEALVRPPCC